MLKFIKTLLTENIGLKLISLVLALILWFYTVNELNKGSEEEMQILSKILPPEQIAAKKLMIKPIFIGKPRWGYHIAKEKTVVVPEFCIVVGARDMLGKVRYAYTTPIDVTNASKAFSKSIPLNPIAPGVYMEETLVQVTVPIEKERGW